MISSSSHNLKTRDGRIVTCPVLRKFVCNLEPGDIDQNIHAQIVCETSMPTDRAHLRKYSSLLRQHINPPPNECKIKVVAMVGRHNISF